MSLDDFEPRITGTGSPGEGLRERNKREKTTRILDAAAVAFGRNGFDGARVDEIAKLAAVSPGTIYSYFTTKENLLLALVLRQRHVGRLQRTPYFRTPSDDPLDAVCAYERCVFESSLKAFDIDLWRRVEASWLLQDQAGMGKAVSGNESLIIEERVSLLEKLQSRGQIPASMDVVQVADILHAVNLHHWIKLLAGEHSDVEKAMESNCREATSLMTMALHSYHLA